jgi:putative ABC transport system permease protein
MFEDAKVSYFLASRAIRRGNKGTTVMTIVILAIVFVNMLFLPSIFEGFLQHFVQKNIDYYSGHMVVYPRENERFIDNATEISQKITGIPGVMGTTRRETTPVIITYRDRVVSKSVLGVDPANEKTVTKLHSGIVSGEFLDEGDTDAIILGAFLAGDRNKKEEEEFFYSLRGIGVGESVQLTFNNGITKFYRVKGIIQTKDQNIDYNAYINIKELEAVTGSSDQASSINIRLSPSVPVNQFKITLMKFGVQQKIRTWLEDAAAARDYMRSFDIMNLVSAIASIIIAIIIMFVVVYINTVNKRKQIGILKAIGIDQRIIVNSYVIQVIFFALCGIALGTILIYSLIVYLTINPMEFPDGDVSPVLNIASMVQAAVTLFIASLIAGYIPAWNTAKQEILAAVRGG